MNTGIWPRLKRRCDEIFGEEHQVLQWIPSPTTVMHIHEQLDRRYGPDPFLSFGQEEQERLLKEFSSRMFSKDQTPWQKASHIVRSALSMPRILSE